jgi:hypothetical protein
VVLPPAACSLFLHHFVCFFDLEGALPAGSYDAAPELDLAVDG